MRSGLALGALLLGLVVLPSSALSAGTDEQGPRVTIFGDSIATSLEYVPDALAYLSAGVDLRDELTPCRKLVPIGCPYLGQRPPSVLNIVKSSSLAQLGTIVIVDVGYNDPANNYETDMAQVVNALVDRGVAHIVWVTMREKTDDYRTINAVIRAQAPRWPQLEIADWEAASSGKDWFNSDGLHLNADGARGLATLLRPYVLAACGSACDATGPSAREPRSVRRPTLAGAPVVGRTVTCRPGSWSGVKPLVLSYRWLRNQTVLAGQHESSRRLVTADRGRFVACRVWAANSAGVEQATSKALRVRTSP